MTCIKCEQRPAATLLGTTLCLICAGLMDPPSDQPEQLDGVTTPPVA